MESQHILELGAGGMSWTAEEQTLPAAIPRLTSRISPASRDKAMRAPEVSEGHGGMQRHWDGGKGLCLREMILWGKEGQQGRKPCNDAGSRVAAKRHPSLSGFGCPVAQDRTSSCFLESRDSNSAAPESHGWVINGGGITCP